MTSLQTSDPQAEPTIEQAKCETHGPFEQRVFPILFSSVPPMRTRCPECVADAEAKRASDEQRQKDAARVMQASNLADRSGVPRRFQARTFADYVPTTPAAKTAKAVCQRYADDFRAQAEQGRSLVLVGGPGTGKTHLACAIVTAVIESDLVRARFTAVSEMLRSIKETYRRESQVTERQAIARFTDCGLLILDEIGVQVGSEHEKLLLFEVLNARYQELLPTILISNLSADELETFLGHRVMDRYRECGVVLAFDWDSYRGRRAA